MYDFSRFDDATRQYLKLDDINEGYWRYGKKPYSKDTYWKYSKKYMPGVGLVPRKHTIAVIPPYKYTAKKQHQRPQTYHTQKQPQSPLLKVGEYKKVPQTTTKFPTLITKKTPEKSEREKYEEKRQREEDTEASYRHMKYGTSNIVKQQQRSEEWKRYKSNLNRTKQLEENRLKQLAADAKRLRDLEIETNRLLQGRPSRTVMTEQELRNMEASAAELMRPVRALSPSPMNIVSPGERHPLSPLSPTAGVLEKFGPKKTPQSGRKTPPATRTATPGSIEIVTSPQEQKSIGPLRRGQKKYKKSKWKAKKQRKKSSTYDNL